MARRAVVYLIEGPGCVYVGETRNPNSRWATHKNDARGTEGGCPVHRAMREMGPERFTFTVVATCATPVPELRYQHDRASKELEEAVIQQCLGSGVFVLNGAGQPNRTRSGWLAVLLARDFAERNPPPSVVRAFKEANRQATDTMAALDSE